MVGVNLDTSDEDEWEVLREMIAGGARSMLEREGAGWTAARLVLCSGVTGVVRLKDSNGFSIRFEPCIVVL